LHNGRILAGEKFADGLVVVIEAGQIAAIVGERKVKDIKADTRIDLNGGWLITGFIDVQVNGGGVLLNNAPTVETLRQIMRGRRRFGTTGMLPTFISDDIGIMAQVIATVRTAGRHG